MFSKVIMFSPSLVLRDNNKNSENISFSWLSLSDGQKTCSSKGWLVGWLFWILRPFETVFQSISGRLPKKGRKKREMIDERKNVQTTPPAPTATVVGPCPTLIQTSRTPRHWKFIQHHRTTRPHPSSKGVSFIGI